MGILIQRRLFDHVDFAQDTAAGFHEPGYKIPGVSISTNIVEQDGQLWLILTQQGAAISSPDAVLPGYELVSFLPVHPS